MKTYGYSYDEKREHIYLIMEYINSKDLGYYIYSYYDKDKYIYKMPIETKISVINSVLKSVRDMWFENIVHVDLKPINLAVQRQGKKHLLKLLITVLVEFDYRNNGIYKEYVAYQWICIPKLNDTCVYS